MEFRKIRKRRRLLRLGRSIRRRREAFSNWMHQHMGWLFTFFAWLRRKLAWMNPRRYVKRMDTYIIKKFIGTYFFSIILIISISIVFDVNENLHKFTTNHAPFKAIVLDYYANSEVIAMLASGMSFKRLLRPYLISAAIIAALNFYLGSFVIPRGNVVRQNFESLYKNKKKNTSALNVQLQVEPGVIAFMSQYDDLTKTGYGFTLDKFENKKIVSTLSANVAQYDTISDSRYHWKLRNYKIRTLTGMREKITSGMTLDTTIMMEPMDLVFSKGQQETLTTTELRRYISKQQERGSQNVVQYEVEYHKRIATSFASFILTIIGASLSSRKRKGGMGMYLGIGLALSFTYILLQTVSATFAIQANTPPILAAWIPNILYTIIAYFCYRQAPN